MRLAQGGLIDRDRPVRFQFDDAWMGGFAGDTLASALMANDIRVVGRSFKYHRPRGLWSAGSDEPNALMQVGQFARQVPNVRATQIELYQGLYARSQNRWPSLRYDLMEVTDLASRFLGAGFYYKTFMWPRRFWERVYEPLIRRAAGLGALSGQANREPYEKAFAHCDLLVIGAGPAGLMAALTAAEAGADVILAEEDTTCGGRLLSERETVDGLSGLDWVAEIVRKLEATGRVRRMMRTTVTGAYDGGVFGALERVGLHLPNPPEALPRECFWRITARRAILAAGAQERPIAFPMNDRPGIMSAAALRSYANRFAVVPGRRVAVFGNNDDAHRTARDLQVQGLEVVAMIDTRPDAPEGDYPVLRGAQVTGSKGRLGLEEIIVQTASGETQLAVDALGVSGGWNPAVHLTCHMNGRPVWDPDLAAFVPRPGAVPGLSAVGAAAGVFSTHSALRSGAEGALQALSELGTRAAMPPIPEAEDAPYAIAPIYAVDGPRPGKDRAWLDFQNDVTVKDVRQAAAENLTSVEHMKRYTTQGMATDQGKSSNLLALAVLADATGRGIKETGTTTYRPPYTPVTLAAMGAGAQSKGFAPERRMTSHTATVAAGAPMLEAGLWYRPSHYPRPGERDWRIACNREVCFVREAVGICDVSTLGKIELRGPDAGAFLDFVYANRISSLRPGRCRYGIMLREDGHVMDDGTVACLAPDHFVLTTTTAAAGQVMQHLDFVQQCLRPELRLRFLSVTEHWAQFAIAGPRARELLCGVLSEAPEAARFPFMSCGAVDLDGVAGRLFRISFSGELGFELAMPARFGASLYDKLVLQAEALGGGAYGMEALNVLRIEKGFLTHAEMDGRVTAGDLGLDRMVAKDKDFIGATARLRPGLADPDRPQLVGLRPLDGRTALPAGAHLFPAGADLTPKTSQGHVTSNCVSPSLGTPLALGFLRAGRGRHGEIVRLVDHLRRVETDCRVTDPVAYDPDGGLARD
ncbi:sarcosine oxidase subunit alpha family protein [Dinoroseobacter sp. S76]|uniref:sarcosine oxidase subunit alpha family protein n=1 Tax=Dinoroseobacter sp. S76 TaxID=3415124 RepID=UPI003C7988C2